MTAAGRGLLVALFVVAGIALAVPPASAQVGTVTIKGKRWTNGNESKVKCIASDGHTFDASVQGTRTITIVEKPDCSIFNDAESGTLEFVFTGEESQVLKNGNPKPFREFVGVQTGASPALGSMAGRIKCSPDCKTEKGVLSFSRDAGGISVIFIGKYKASFN
jgi:hypothetical protein